MSGILISYRREDSADVTERIYDRLLREFGRDSVFKIGDAIPLGVDFRAYLDAQVAKCEVFLAIIGLTWINIGGSKGKPRLEDPADFVRIELESALKRGIPVIPVLVSGATIPAATHLPLSLQDLTYRHGLSVRPDPDFHHDMDRLIEYLNEQIRQVGESSTARPAGMVKVPKGPFLYGDDNTRTVIDYDYGIGIYPVTNQEFGAFISAQGYEHPSYWSEEGWAWKAENNINSPENWNVRTRNNTDHPVAGVSFYEAEAYAKWAGKRLPTEQEWEKGARGTDGRRYPWGDKFEKTKCNTFESGLRHTSHVRQYPDGVSPYGCYDMAGNVWEWCASENSTDREKRAIRGGSWGSYPGFLRSSDRVWKDAGDRDGDIGFRLARHLES